MEKKDGNVVTAAPCRRIGGGVSVDKVEAGQVIQDGAISDLGEVSSLLAEQIEGGAV